MQQIEGIPKVIPGVAYYSSIKVAKPDFNGDKYGYEINLAVSDEIFQAFKDAGFNAGLYDAGSRKYTEDPVILFYLWEKNSKGTPNDPPMLINTDMEDIDVQVGNGSKVNVQWRSSGAYGPSKQYKRAVLEVVQVVDLVEYAPQGSVKLAFE